MQRRHISDVHDYSPSETEQAKTFLSQNRKDAIRREIEQIIDEEFDRLEEHADEYISGVAADRAERFLARVLEGDDDAAKELLGDTTFSSDRYRLLGPDATKPWAHLIHGRLFETGGIQLRRQIAEAHADLIRNERIADLESIVDGLSRQVRELETELDDAHERLR